MIEFYKRWWQVFLPLFAVFGLGSLQAFYYLDKCSYQWIVITVLFILAIICLIIGIIGFIKVFRDACREEREKKREATHKALIESFKTLYIKQGKSVEESQKLAELAAADIPSAPPIEGEEEWLSPREAFKKLCRKRK